MARAIAVLLLVLSILLAGGLLVWHLSFRAGRTLPETAHLPALSAEARIQWTEDGVVVIQARDTLDALRTLGMAQGLARTWQLVLLRQAALSRLGTWFGDADLPADSLTMRLGLADEARAFAARLPEAERRRLEALASGINAAFATEYARMTPQVLLLPVPLDRWEPWHTLAVERLLAWLAAPPLEATPPAPEIRALARADERLRQRLQLNGFEHSTAWTVQDATGTHLFYRLVYGASATPLYLDVVLQINGATVLSGACLPGTYAVPAGRSQRHDWVVLPTATRRLHRRALGQEPLQIRHGRIVGGDGTERLLDIPRLGGTLPFLSTRTPPSDATAADSVWVLSWSGFSSSSDVRSWWRLAETPSVPFTLFDGSGLALTPDGTVRVLGQPAFSYTWQHGVLVGSTFWTSSLAARLEALSRQAADGVHPVAWMDDAVSPWAADLAPVLIQQLTRRAILDPLVTDALAYLRNWNFAYDGPSIAAPVFDAWLTELRQQTGRLPTPRDTLDADLLYATLEAALRDLSASFGRDMSRWRRESVLPDIRYFTPWTPTFPTEDIPALFYPLERPGSGHPSTLAWGPSVLLPPPPAPGSREGWHPAGRKTAPQVRRLAYVPDQFLGRYTQAGRKVPFVPLAPSPRYTVTVLTPVRP